MKLPLIKRDILVSVIAWIGILLLVLIPIFLLANMNASSDNAPDSLQQEATEEMLDSQSVEATPESVETEETDEVQIEEDEQEIDASPTPEPSATRDSSVSTPTLLPPPTFEPPTQTPTPSQEPLPTEVPTLDLSVGDIDINGLETPTPTSEVECEPRDDWQLTYQVQAFDTLSSIADLYSTTIFDLADGNCMDNPDLITIGQVLRVPGDAPPAQAQYECVPWEVLTPIDNAFNIDGAGQMTFVWRGPRAPRNLVRVYDSNGNIALEVTVDLAQNATITLPIDLPNAGVYTWYVYPLDWNFIQIPCREGGPWRFHKNDGS